MNDTIAAIATPLAQGAISIIKVSGQDAIECVNKIFDRNLNEFERNTINYGNIVVDGEIIDEVMVSIFKGPHSFTREDVVEINTHGGVLVTKKVLSLILANGARLANPGEFSQRAYLNGRLDLTQAEAINDLIEANNDRGLKLAVSGLKGSVKRLLDPLIEDLLNTIAVIEVNIDYPEYDDVEMLSNEIVKPRVDSWVIDLEKIIDRAYKTQEIKDGVKTVIVGEPNVGKSSIFNALIEQDKAIVTNIAGTTRDLIEDKIRLENVTLALIDTAGLRDTDDIIEQIGISKTKEALEAAEFVIMVLDASRPINEFEEELLELIKDQKHIIVHNKTDINDIGEIKVSAINDDVTNLEVAINEMFKDNILDVKQDSLNNERQIGLALKALNHFKDALNTIAMGMELELVAIDLNDGYLSLKEILGEVSRDDLLDTLFSKFCLGK
ncbi:MAG: tRNA uridine-5-carboxymethylaminomethyl(34) synthesis GTPase MnmE [Erysipelothrix sp.]|nr:tRNA uridine-5-carboxymethylaminomethyl(34) synthesis GTPase MnmE [Erysipelothrix sp.]